MSDKQFPACFGCGAGFDQENLIYEHLPGCTFNPKGHACTWINCKSCIQGHAEERARMKRWFRVELLEVFKDEAPCLIDGHTAEVDVLIGILERVERDYIKRTPIGQRANTDGVKIPINFKLCARCGVVYEEKAK